MKKVSYKVAVAIREAGYPQYEGPISEVGWYNRAGNYTKEFPWIWKGDDEFIAIAPNYFEVWGWLWREKNIKIILQESWTGYAVASIKTESFRGATPEDVIEEAIEYLVDNDLIK